MWEHGEQIKSRTYSNHIYENSDIATILRAVDHEINWPPTHILVVIKGIGYTHVDGHIRLIDVDRDRNVNDKSQLVIKVAILRPPDEFDMVGLCICSFPGYGCCVTGRKDDQGILDDRCKRKLSS